MSNLYISHGSLFCIFVLESWQQNNLFRSNRTNDFEFVKLPYLTNFIKLNKHSVSLMCSQMPQIEEQHVPLRVLINKRPSNCTTHQYTVLCVEEAKENKETFIYMRGVKYSPSSTELKWI